MDMKKENIKYIRTLPDEIQNNIFFMFAEHPLASIFKQHVTVTVKTRTFYRVGDKETFQQT